MTPRRAIAAAFKSTRRLSVSVLCSPKCTRRAWQILAAKSSRPTHNLNALFSNYSATDVKMTHDVLGNICARPYRRLVAPAAAVRATLNPAVRETLNPKPLFNTSKDRPASDSFLGSFPPLLP